MAGDDMFGMLAQAAMNEGWHDLGANGLGDGTAGTEAAAGWRIDGTGWFADQRQTLAAPLGRRIRDWHG